MAERVLSMGERRCDCGAIVYSIEICRCVASGTEARRATTVEQGVVHDGPVAKPDAPNAP